MFKIEPRSLDSSARTPKLKRLATTRRLRCCRWRPNAVGRVEPQASTWHRCIVWGKLAGFAATLTKGAHVQIEGDIRSREYQPSGKSTAKKTITEIRVASITKLDCTAKSEETAV